MFVAVLIAPRKLWSLLDVRYSAVAPPQAVSLSSVLTHVVMDIAFLAFIFLVIGAARMPRQSTLGALSAEEIQRLKAIRRADWRSAVLLLGIALLTWTTTLIGRGPFFDERSGNVAGGMLLIAGIVGLILVIVLLIRYMGLSRALRTLETRSRKLR
jgi:uncharacterized membrane protein